MTATIITHFIAFSVGGILGVFVMGLAVAAKND